MHSSMFIRDSIHSSAEDKDTALDMGLRDA